MASAPADLKVALVTGAARRLGAALALDLARKGWNLWLHFRHSRSEAEALAARIGAMGRSVWTVQADLSAEGGAERLADRVALTPPSLVVHSASSWIEDSLLTAAPEAWQGSHRVHGWTAVVLGRALAVWAEQTAADTQLVTLLDSRLRDRDPSHFSYGFAKRELALLTRYLAAELAPRVRVNGIAPGLVLKADGMSSARWAWAGRESTPLGRVGKSSDVVKALRYLVDNPFVTGQILTVDGGRHLKGDLFGSL